VAGGDADGIRRGPAGRAHDARRRGAGRSRGATIHPSAILRGSDSDARDAQRELFTEDLRVAAEAAGVA